MTSYLDHTFIHLMVVISICIDHGFFRQHFHILLQSSRACVPSCRSTIHRSCAPCGHGVASARLWNTSWSPGWTSSTGRQGRKWPSPGRNVNSENMGKYGENMGNLWKSLGKRKDFGFWAGKVGFNTIDNWKKNKPNYWVGWKIPKQNVDNPGLPGKTC